MKINITAIFRFSERLHFEVIKRLISPEKFRDFQETGPRPELLDEKKRIGFQQPDPGGKSRLA